MAPKPIVLIDGNLYYLENGNYYPYRISTRGGGGGSRIPVLTDVTYSQLISFINSNSLRPGYFYRITNFRTREQIPNTSEIILGPIEPLIVQAATANSLSESAISQSFPSDIIYYEAINASTSADDRGRIYYRNDTTKDVSAWYNWRVIKFRRWESTMEPGKFIVLTDNGNDSIDFYTFNNSSSAENCGATHIGKLTPPAITFAMSLGVDISDGLNNFVLGCLSASDFTINNNFADDNFYNTIIVTGDGALVGTVTKALFAGTPPPAGEFTGNSYYDSKTFINNVWDVFAINNRMHEDFNANKFGAFCIQNIFETGYISNNHGDNFQNNIFGELCAGNTFGINCSLNVTGDRFGVDSSNNIRGNTCGDVFAGNLIGDENYNNEYGNACAGNIFGDDNHDNEIEHNFKENKTGDSFQFNHIESDCGGQDWTVGATRVYGAYTKELVKKLDGVFVLRYTDNTPPFGALVYDSILS